MEGVIRDPVQDDCAVVSLQGDCDLYSAPKFKAPKGYGGGGHFSAPRAPKMSHSSGSGGHHRF